MYRSKKRDHSGYFIKIKFLAWINSSVCAEYNGASFMKKILIINGVMTIFIHTGRYIGFWENAHFKIIIKLYESEQLFTSITIVYILQLQHSISIIMKPKFYIFW